MRDCVFPLAPSPHGSLTGPSLAPCRCRFAPLVGLCFERAEKYLFLAYGAGFRRPHQAHTQRIDLLNYNGR